MKVMTCNLLNGAVETLEDVIAIVNSENPDFLTLNEVNGFDESDSERLHKFAKETKFPYYHLALSGEYDYHVAVFSRKPFKELREVRPLARAGILAVVETELGDVSFVGTHLTPYTEALRLPEIDLLIREQKPYGYKVLMGDLNSLSLADGYDETVIEKFNPMQEKKFTRGGKLCFDAMKKFEENGYVDAGIVLGKNKERTAPTEVNEFDAHSDMRLDYVLVSASLEDKLSDYRVIRNELTDKASDHYPVVVTLG
jgi:exodeoxyribonuclease-3